MLSLSRTFNELAQRANRDPVEEVPLQQHLQLAPVEDFLWVEAEEIIQKSGLCLIDLRVTRWVGWYGIRHRGPVPPPVTALFCTAE